MITYESHCLPELIVSAHIIEAEEQWMGEKSEDSEINEHFGVRNSNDHIFQVEQQKRAASNVSQFPNSSQQRSPMKRGRTDDNWAVK